MADGSLWEGLQQPVPVQKGLWDGLYDPGTGMPYPGNAPDYGDLSQRMTNFEQRLPGHIASGIRDWIAVPGQAYGTVPGGPPTPEQELEWGRGTALGQLGMARMPGMAGTGAVGAGGAKLVQPEGIFAYHSSPYTFDKFDLSKIGTGEGAQVYGHGIYAAENPAVSGQGGQYWQQFTDRFRGPEGQAAERLYQSGFDRDKAIADLQKHLETSRGRAGMADQERALDLLRSGQPVGPRTYEVNINARPEQMLDWFKPLAEQTPYVKDVALQMGVPPDLYTLPGGRLANRLGGATGEDFYHALRSDLGSEQPILGTRYTAPTVNEAAASQALNEAGIPGIRYLDQGSRNAGDWHITPPSQTVSGKWMVKSNDYNSKGLHFDTEAAAQAALAEKLNQRTHNYVIFDPNKLDIRKMYAVPGAVGAGAASTGGMWDSLFPQREEQ
jgi:hypothetical protein